MAIIIRNAEIVLSKTTLLGYLGERKYLELKRKVRNIRE